ncbi:hypothetical protein N9937_02100 [bacterium]|nr:hypothetical protein [bacterium]
MPMITITLDDESEVDVPVRGETDAEIDSYINSPKGESAIDTYLAVREASVPQTVLQAAKNLPESTGRFLGDMFTVITDPVGVAESIGDLALGVVQTLDGTTEFDNDQRGKVRALSDMFETRYGGVDNVKHTFATDPAGLLSDVAGLLVAGGGGIKAASAAGKLRSIKAAGALGAVGDTLIAAGKATDPFAVIGKAGKVAKIDKVVSHGMGLMSKTKGAIENKLISGSIKLTPGETTKLSKPNVLGMRPSEWLLENKISGSLPEMARKLDELGDASKATLDETLKAMPTRFKTDSADKILNSLGDAYKNIPNKSRRTESLLKQIDYAKVKHATTGVTLEELNRLKRVMDSEMDIFKTTNEIKDNVNAKNLGDLRDELKTFIEDTASSKFGVNNVKALNKKVQGAKTLRQAILKSDEARASNRWITLTDHLFTTGVIAGGAYSGQPGTAMSIFAFKKLAESPAARTKVANMMGKMSKKNLDIISDAIANKYAGTKASLLLRQVYNAAKVEAIKDFAKNAAVPLQIPARMESQLQDDELTFSQ